MDIFSRVLLTLSKPHSHHCGFLCKYLLLPQLYEIELIRRHGYAICYRSTALRCPAAGLCPEAFISQPTSNIPARAAKVPRCPFKNLLQVLLELYQSESRR